MIHGLDFSDGTNIYYIHQFHKIFVKKINSFLLFFQNFVKSKFLLLFVDILFALLQQFYNFGHLTWKKADIYALRVYITSELARVYYANF